MTADFGGFRVVRYLPIIFSLYRFEFHTKLLFFTVSNMSNFVLTKQHLREVLVFCFNWKKSAAGAHRMLVEVYGGNAPTDKSTENGFDVSRMVISALKTSLALDSQKNSKTQNWRHYSMKIRVKRKRSLQNHWELRNKQFAYD